MLQNIVLYSTSTAAQVWAAIMVFLVVVLREANSRKETGLTEQWNLARLYWGPLIKNLTDPNSQMVNQLRQYELDRHLIHKVDTDKNEFIKFIQAIKKHRLVTVSNQAVFFPERNENLSPDRWQSKFDPIAESVEALVTHKEAPLTPFLWGSGVIAFNLVVMGLSGLWAESTNALWATVTIVIGCNLFVGLVVTRKVYKSISA